MKILSKRSIVPTGIFIVAVSVFITFQMTFLFVNNRWEKRVAEMINTDKTTLSEAVSSVDSVIKSKSVTQGQSDMILDSTLQGYLSGTGDKFAMYMNEVQYKDYLTLANAEQGLSSGIGISALYDATVDGIYIVNVYESSPAEKAGIVPGDIITHINYAPVSEYGFYGAMLEIATGQALSYVRLALRKSDGSVKEITVTRNIVSFTNITSRMYDDKIGVIRINEFSGNSYEDFKSVLQDLVTGSAEGIVIDVRNNPGGSLDAIAHILDFLLPEGVVLSGTTKTGNVVTVRSDINEFSFPMAVLINKNTVCGAEMFAGALSEAKKAQTFGENTYGKATTQEIFSVMPKGVISFSTTRYVLPSGKSFENVGLVPDNRVIQTYSGYPFTDDVDSVLAKAAEALNMQIEQKSK